MTELLQSWIIGYLGEKTKLKRCLSVQGSAGEREEEARAGGEGQGEDRAREGRDHGATAADRGADHEGTERY